ncbi:MAG: EAL domain-containing protein [Glaciecola sp.]
MKICPCIRVVVALLLCLVSLSTYSSDASIKAPRLSYLDTNDGLDQDTVEAIHIDSSGFIWIGTGEGLNRFDGVKVLKIHGQNNILSSTPVYNIFEHSSGMFYISTADEGIVKFNPITRETVSVLSPSMHTASDWLQYSEDMVELTSGELLIAMSESVYLFDHVTNQATLLYSLLPEQLDEGDSIRSIYAHDNLIFIGSSAGLRILDRSSEQVFRLMGEQHFMLDQTNVKELLSVDNQRLFVGTVQGLYAFNLGEIESFVNKAWDKPEPEVIEPNRNIWDVVEIKNNLFFIGTDIGLYKYDAVTGHFEYLFEPTKNVEVLSNKDISNLAIDENGNVWFGTVSSGAVLWSPKSLLFDNIYNSVFTSENNLLSHNAVWALYQYSPQALFIGTSNGLNKYNLQSKNISQYLVNNAPKTDYTESEILKIASTDRGFLWLVTGSGLRYFDVNSGEMVPLPVSTDAANELLNQWTYSTEFDETNRLWILIENGIYVLDLDTENITQVDLKQAGLSINNVWYLLGVDKLTNSMLVSASSELWGIDLDTFEIRLLHSIKNETRNKAIHVDSFLRSNNNTDAWISYPGVGLYRLDGTSFEILEKFSTDNLLPTNVVYSLNEDKDGDIWFSSHSGIHSLDISSNYVSSFGVLNGLASSEFNQSAAYKLSDRRFAYGTNVGVSLFDPRKLKATAQSPNRELLFTEATLSNRSLITPLNGLNNITLALHHDDSGLTLHYSDMAFDTHTQKRYNYRIISGNETTTYPGLNTNKIILANLSPGTHEIQIYKTMDTQARNMASITLKVAYPPFASPIAYLLYAFIVSTAGIIFYIRRLKVKALITQADQQVKTYNKRLTEALIASNADIWEWSSVTDLMHGARIEKELHETGNSSCVKFDDYLDKIHEEDRDKYHNAWLRFTRATNSHTDDTFDVTYRVVSKSNKTLWYRDIGSIAVLPNGGFEVKGTYTNLTDRVVEQEKLKLFGNAFKHTRDWVLIFDKNKQLVATNPAFKRAFSVDLKGNSQEHLLNQHQEVLYRTTKKLTSMKAGERWKTEFTIDVNGKRVNLLTDFNAVADEKQSDTVDYYLLIATDISEQINAQQELQKLANYDVLTGLVNRTLLLERLNQSINFAVRHQHKLAVLFIDLDGFKPINDSFGHVAGDAVLIEIGKRLRSQFRQQDSVARIGGDEFVVVLEEVSNLQSVGTVVSDLLASIEPAIVIDKHSVSVSASIGIAIYPSDGVDAEHLLTNADIAMYNAKEQGKNRYQYYTEEMNERVQENIILQNRVKVAAQGRAFVNFYQPIVDLHTNTTAGMELLLRWLDKGQHIPPDVFIPVTEQVGYIVDVTMHAIQNAINDLATWYQNGFKGYVAVNLSAKHFATRPQFEVIQQWLQEHDLPTSCLRFEITESLLIDNDEHTLAYMHEMQALGFKIALDDFGTGYSSLKYLKDFPLDALKIDRSFVKDMTHDKGTESIVQSTLFMTRLLSLDTVAEGVETQQQLDYFKQNGCRFVQGFLYAKPMPVEQMSKLLSKQWSNTD